MSVGDRAGFIPARPPKRERQGGLERQRAPVGREWFGVHLVVGIIKPQGSPECERSEHEALSVYRVRVRVSRARARGNILYLSMFLVGCVCIS